MNVSTATSNELIIPNTFYEKKFTVHVLAVFILLFPILEGFSNEYLPIGTKYLGFLLAFIWLLETLYIAKIRINSTVIFFGVYVIWNALSIFWTVDILFSVSRLIGFVQVFLLYWIINDVVKTRQDLIRLMTSYVLGVALLSISAIINLFSSITYGDLYNRFSAMGSDPNNFGIIVVSSIPLAYFISSVKGRTWWSLVYAAFSVPLVLSTASRGASLALAVIFIGYFFVFFRSFRKMIILSLIAAIAIILIRNYVPPEATSRLNSVLSDDTGGGRTEIWRLAFKLGSNVPLTGYGAGTFFSISQYRLSLGMDAHNTFLASWAELGLIGVTLWILLWILHFKQIFSLKSFYKNEDHAMKVALLFTIITLLIGATFLNWEIRKPIYIVWGLIGSLELLKSKKGNEEKS